MMNNTLNLELLDRPERRKERVEISAGSLWVWELLTGDWAMLHQQAARPAIDPRGGVDEHAAVLAQIQFSCYASDAEDARRVFMDEKGVARIRNLKRTDFQAIMDAFNRVNGTDASEAEEVRGFFDPTPEDKNGSSEPSASVASAV